MSKVLHKLAATRLNPEEEEAQVVAPKKGGAKGSKKSENNEVTTDDNKAKLSLQLRPISKGKKEAAAESAVPSSSIIYLGHIPKGFFESEMRKFFSQFGMIKRLKLFRSRKTNNSKGYAFVEFESSEVAKVVAESMNGYFLSDRQLKSHVVAPEKIHDGMFKFHFKRKEGDDDESDSSDDDEAEEGEGAKKEEKEKKTEESLITNDTFQTLLAKRESVMQKKLQKLQAMGIEYTIPQIPGVESVKAVLTKEKEGKSVVPKAAKKGGKVVEKAAPVVVEELAEVPAVPKKKGGKKQKASAVEEESETAAAPVVAQATTTTTASEDKPKKKKTKVSTA